MNLYFELLKKPIFRVEDVNEYYNNIDSARSAIKRLKKENMIYNTQMINGDFEIISKEMLEFAKG